MATREVLTLVCDLCGREGGDVETRRPCSCRELEACARCWSAHAGMLEQLAQAARRRGTPARRRRRAAARA